MPHPLARLRSHICRLSRAAAYPEQICRAGEPDRGRTRTQDPCRPRACRHEQGGAPRTPTHRGPSGCGSHPRLGRCRQSGACGGVPHRPWTARSQGPSMRPLRSRQRLMGAMPIDLTQRLLGITAEPVGAPDARQKWAGAPGNNPCRPGTYKPHPRRHGLKPARLQPANRSPCPAGPVCASGAAGDMACTRLVSRGPDSRPRLARLGARLPVAPGVEARPDNRPIDCMAKAVLA